MRSKHPGPMPTVTVSRAGSGDKPSHEGDRPAARRTIHQPTGSSTITLAGFLADNPFDALFWRGLVLPVLTTICTCSEEHLLAWPALDLLTLLQTQPSPALLLAIAGRLWPDLKNPELLGLFLEQLALQPTQFFNQVFAELVTLPALRNDMLAKLRDPERSEALGLAMDYEWMNRQLFYNAYQRVNGLFGNTACAASGVPGADELALLEPLRAKLKPEVLSQPVPMPPTTTEPGSLRHNLRQARDLFKAAGWTIQQFKKRDLRK